MPVRYLSTDIYLPPGPPSSVVIEKFLRLVFEKYRWFVPVRYGRSPSWDERLEPGHINYDALISVYEKYQSLCVAARTDKDFICIFPARADSPPHKGKLLWDTSVRSALGASWRVAHIDQVAEVMRIVRSPLAVAALAEDRERKTRRMVPCDDGIGSMESPTVRNYSEGLAGLFWRNFFGPPFVSMFGERLASLPEDCRKPLGDGLVLVQPYELPTDAGTEHGDALERALIEHLGPECFYDHTHHLKPSRLPLLAPPGT
ncbi:hypothetical protein [Archangium lipolyticum]|uniref:hypothetical protein n=1 Tax=Archangium lipolyticum TaxID=2970465 RepID=UPI00214A6788|nr:hypothetical protein [Archangium lipolyticum]